MFINSTEAQILKKLKDKAKAITNQKTDAKADQKIGTAVDSVLEGNIHIPKSKKESKADPAQNQTEQVQANAVTEITENNVNRTTYKSKFDFIPGEKIVIWEDFNQDAVGDFPAKWFTNGSGEIVTIDGQEGKWLMTKASSEYFIDQLLNLPENFTIQFDLMCSIPFDWSSGEITIKLADTKDIATYRSGRNDGSMSSGKFNFPNFSFDLHPGVINAGGNNTKGYGHYKKDIESGNLDLKEIFMPATDQNILKVSIWRQKQRIRIYLNENKILDLPRILPLEMKPNILAIQTSRLLENSNYFIGNLRIAIGNPDTRNKLLTEGKLVTNGILFGINSAVIKPESYGVLKGIANILKEDETVKVNIIGHTDSDGDEAKNLELSKRRAAAVKSALVQDFNIASDRLETDGKGESEPAVPNTSALNKASNRRVEFIKIN